MHTYVKLFLLLTSVSYSSSSMSMNIIKNLLGARTQPSPVDNYATFCGVIKLAKLSAQGSDLSPEAATRFDGPLVCKKTSSESCVLECTSNNHSIGTIQFGKTGVRSGLFLVTIPQPHGIFTSWGLYNPIWGGKEFNSRNSGHYPFFKQVVSTVFKRDPFYITMVGSKVISIDGKTIPEAIVDEVGESKATEEDCREFEKNWMSMVEKYNKDQMNTKTN